MEKRKTVWFSVPISTLIQAAEEKSSVKIQFSHDELMEQILDDNYASHSISTEKIFKDLFSRDNNDEEERLTAIKCCFEQSFLKELVENKNGYTTSVSWKDALSLALDQNYWYLNIPADIQDEDEEDEDEATFWTNLLGAERLISKFQTTERAV